MYEFAIFQYRTLEKGEATANKFSIVKYILLEMVGDGSSSMGATTTIFEIIARGERYILCPSFQGSLSMFLRKSSSVVDIVDSQGPISTIVGNSCTILNGSLCGKLMEAIKVFPVAGSTFPVR